MNDMTVAANDAVAEGLDGLDGVSIERAVSAASLCTYRVGGPIDVLASVETPRAMELLVPRLADHDIPTLPLGRGSNLLVADGGFDGIGILPGEGLSSIEIDRTRVVVGAGAALPVVARATARAGLAGFEWAVGVPGSIGGAVRMNAGGHGSDMSESLVSVDIADLAVGRVVTTPAEELELGYRTSALEPWQIVVSATLNLQPGNAETADIAIREIVSWRRAHQPGGQNAGSVFTNPPGDSAGRLIDAAGMKGHRVRSAVVSEKHANFIQVDPDGAADDVMSLMVDIVDRVRNHSGIRLHAETRLIGFAPDLVEHVQGTPTPGETPGG